MVENRDDVTINLVGVKKFFHDVLNVVRKKEGVEAVPEIARVVGFVKKHAVLIVLLLVVAMQFVPNAGFLPWGGLWMRLQSEKLPLIDVWAINSVHNFYRNQIAEKINQQNQNLPDAAKVKLIDGNLERFLQVQNGEVEKQISGTIDFLKDQYQYEYKGVKYTYMPDIDSYFYLRRAENYLKNGLFGDELRDGVEWDNHAKAPLGAHVGRELHFYVLAYVHKVFSFFKDVPPMQSMAYSPIVIVLFAVIFAFLAGYRLAGLTGGFFVATLLSISTVGVSRTMWGHVDTDGYNLFFPMLILWCLIEAFEAETLRRRVGFLVGLSAAVGLYSFAWIGWWYLFDFIVFALVVYAVYLVWVEFQNKKDVLQVFAQPSIKFVLFFLGAFIVLSGFFVSIFVGVVPFFRAPLSPFDFSIIKSAAHVDLWPNVYTTVAELNPISIGGIITILGGRMLFGFALLGVVLLALRRKKSPTSVLYAVLLSIFLVGGVYASTKGVRFTLLLVPAVSIAFGVSAGLLMEKFQVKLQRYFQVPHGVTAVVVVFVFACVILQSWQVEASFQNAHGEMPIVNDAWFNALTAIKEQSPENAVVNSWWDFGHHFKYFADRAVTFDGGSQNSPMAHWIGRVLLTEDEDEAVGILRMLDCGSHYKAWDALIPQVENDTVRAVKTLYKIFPIHNKLKAREILVNEGLSDPDSVLQFTHCENPPENYFIVSEDMVGKSGVWSHFGSWNFERAYAWIVLKNQPKEQAVGYMMNNFNYSKETAEEVYKEVTSLPTDDAVKKWISPMLGYPMGMTSCSQNGPFSLQCGRVSISLKDNNDVQIRTPQGLGVPKYVVYVNESTNKLQKARVNNSNMDLAVVLVPRQGGYAAMVTSSPMGVSMFTRLFFMEGHGLKYFIPVTSQNQIAGGAIHVYKTDWKAHEPLVASALRPKITVEQGSTVSVNYVGYLENGTVFDASIPDWIKENVSSKSNFDDFKTTPLSFVVGAGQTIPGFEQGLLGMNVNEEKILKIPPDLAYGTDPTKHPLGNQTLNFKIRVEKIR